MAFAIGWVLNIETLSGVTLSASTTVVNPAAGKYHYTGEWEDIFFPSPFQNHKAFVRMAASLPYIIHFSVIHFLWEMDGVGVRVEFESACIWMTALLMLSVRWHSKWRKGGGSMGLKMHRLWMSTLKKSKFYFSVPAGCVFSVICFAWLCAFCLIVQPFLPIEICSAWLLHSVLWAECVSSI